MKLWPWLLGLVGVGVAGAVVFATAEAKAAPKSAANNALDALRTGDPSVMQSTALVLAPTAVAQAAGLQRAAIYVRSLVGLPADVAGSIVASVRGVNASQMKALAAQLQPRGYPTQATELVALADFVAWLQAPAQQVSPPPKAGQSPAGWVHDPDSVNLLGNPLLDGYTIQTTPAATTPCWMGT